MFIEHLHIPCTVLSISHALSHLVLHDRFYYFPHFPSELKHERQATCPTSWGLYTIKAEFESSGHMVHATHHPQTHPHSGVSAPAGLCLHHLSTCPSPALPISLSLFSFRRLSLTTPPVWRPPCPHGLSQHPSLHSHHHMKLFAELFFGCLAHKSISSMKTPPHVIYSPLPPPGPPWCLVHSTCSVMLWHTREPCLHCVPCRTPT